MKLSRFRRKSFTSLKKRKSTKKRRQTKRRPMKKFNIRKTHHMRGGGEGEMVILTEQDIKDIKACRDIFDYIKTNIAVEMGIEHIPDTKTFKIHTQTSTMYIFQKENPDTYGTLLTIYNNGTPIPVPPPPKIINSSAAAWDYERNH
jgi:hypothetical protein